MQGAQVPSLAGELRSHMVHGVAKKKSDLVANFHLREVNTQTLLRPPVAGPALAGMLGRPWEPKGHLAPSSQRLQGPPWVAGHLDSCGSGDKPRLFQVSKTPKLGLIESLFGKFH